MIFGDDGPTSSPTDGNDQIFAYSGDDIVYGGGGNDTIDLGPAMTKATAATATTS